MLTNHADYLLVCSRAARGGASSKWGWDFLVCCFSGHLLALPAAAGTAAASAASAAASAAAIVVSTSTTAKAVVKTRAAAEAAAVPAAAGKASKCSEKQQTRKSQAPSNVAPLWERLENNL